MRTVYLACPIDYDAGKSLAWAQEARSMLRGMGYVVFCPILAWDLDMHELTAKGAHYVQSVNDCALLTADILVARLSGPSCGVPREIIIADDTRKPIYVIRENWQYKTVFEWNCHLTLLNDIYDLRNHLEDYSGEDED
jgi:hypothetical protein